MPAVRRASNLFTRTAREIRASANVCMQSYNSHTAHAFEFICVGFVCKTAGSESAPLSARNSANVKATHTKRSPIAVSNLHVGVYHNLCVEHSACR